MKTAAKSHPETVLFLGAGASAAFGYPVTSQILPRIRAGLQSGDLFPTESNPRREREKLARLREYLQGLLPAFFEQDVVFPLVTDVLSLIDHLLAGDETAIPTWTQAQLRDCRTLLEQAIIETIRTPDPTGSLRDSLEHLTDWMLSEKTSSGSPVTVISTNYDNLLESRLFEKIEIAPDIEIPEVVDMGFSWREHSAGKYLERVNHPPSNPWLRLYKLHGSMNWVRCPLCGFLYVNTVGEIYRQAYRGDKVDYNNTCVCGHGPVRSVIVAPSMVRSVDSPDLRTIWRNALEALRTADEWIIAGYSLPPEDIAIRSILIRAYHGRSKRRQAPKIKVVQFGEDRNLEARFRLLFPESRFRRDGFIAYVETLPEPARSFPTF